MFDSVGDVGLLFGLLGIVDLVLPLPYRRAQKLVFHAGPDQTGFTMSSTRIWKVQVSRIQGPLQLFEMK